MVTDGQRDFVSGVIEATFKALTKEQRAEKQEIYEDAVTDCWLIAFSDEPQLKAFLDSTKKLLCG